LSKEPFQAMLATCDDSLRGQRDRALLLFAWATGGRRRSEVVAATVESLCRVEPAVFLYSLTQSKTNQAGVERPQDTKPLVGSAGEAMEAWLAASGINSGALFRRVRKGGHLGEALSAASVRDIVKERCALAGVEGEFSAHSLRSGFVTEAGRQNMPLAETMAMTGHQSVASVVGYFRAETALGSRIASLLDNSGLERRTIKP
jgi:integrase